MKTRNKETGFSLIELIVSLTLIAAALTSAYTVIGVVSQTVIKSKSIQDIAYLGDRHLRELKFSKNLEPGLFNGSYEDDIHWSLELKIINEYPQALTANLRVWNEFSKQQFHTIVFRKVTEQ